MLNKIVKGMVIFIILALFSFPAFAENKGELIRQAKDYYDNQVYKKAFDAAAKLLNMDPGLLEAHRVYVKSSHKIGQKEFEACIAFYEDKCNKIFFWDKSRPAWLYGMGLAYALATKKPEATDAFNSCIKLDPRSPLVDEIQKVASEYKLELAPIPTRSLMGDIQFYAIIAGVILLFFILWMIYKGYEERKTGKRQADSIKKDRQIDFFGNIRKQK